MPTGVGRSCYVLKPKANIAKTADDHSSVGDKGSLITSGDFDATPRSTTTPKVQHHIEMAKILEIENNSLQDNLLNIWHAA